MVGGSAFALALIGTAGAYAGGVFGSGGSGTAGQVNVAGKPPVPEPSALQSLSPGEARERALKSRTGSGAVSAEQLTDVFKRLLPGGTVSGTVARGSGDELGPMVQGVYDDGKGKGSIGVSLTRVDPNGQMAAQMVKCPSQRMLNYDSCTSETLADGSKLMLFQGYEYPDRRVDTKNWRATMVTPQGFMIDAQEHNAAAEKGAATTRPMPPLTLAQLKTFTTSPLWLPALNDLPAAPVEAPPQESGLPSGVKAVNMLEHLLRSYEIPAVSTEDNGDDIGNVVLDDGKGQSLVSLQIQPDSKGRPGMWKDLFTGAETLPDGTKIVTRQQPGEKGGKGVVWWTVEVLRTNGTRLIVSEFNSKSQITAATRKEPVLTMAQLREIATSPKWAESGM